MMYDYWIKNILIIYVEIKYMFFNIIEEHISMLLSVKITLNICD